MQVCTLLQTDNRASTPPLSFLQAGCPSCRPTNSVKALKAWMLLLLVVTNCLLVGSKMTIWIWTILQTYNFCLQEIRFSVIYISLKSEIFHFLIIRLYRWLNRLAHTFSMLTHNSSLSGQSVGRNSHLEINLCALLAWRCTILWESLDWQCTNLYTVRHLYFMEQKHNKRQIHRNPSRSHHIWAISATTSIITPIFA